MSPADFGIYQNGVLIGIALGHALLAFLKANGGNADFTFQIRNGKVLPRFEARLVGNQEAETVPEKAEPPAP